MHVANKKAGIAVGLLPFLYIIYFLLQKTHFLP